MNKNTPRESTLKFIEEIKSKNKRTTTFLGEKIIIHKNVFPVDSVFSFSSKITAKRIPKNVNSVLDVGTGTGVQSIIAAKRGAKKVLAIDIDNNCLKNTKENVKFHKLEKIISIRKSNLFKNVKPNEKFDLIISQLPFADAKYKDKVSHFLFDSDFKLHEKFLKSAKKYLTKNGKIFIPSGEIANEEKLLELIKKYNYKIVKVHKEIFQDLKWKLYVLK